MPAFCTRFRQSKWMKVQWNCKYLGKYDTNQLQLINGDIDNSDEYFQQLILNDTINSLSLTIFASISWFQDIGILKSRRCEQSRRHGMSRFPISHWLLEMRESGGKSTSPQNGSLFHFLRILYNVLPNPLTPTVSEMQPVKRNDVEKNV